MKRTLADPPRPNVGCAVSWTDPPGKRCGRWSTVCRQIDEAATAGYRRIVGGAPSAETGRAGGRAGASRRLPSSRSSATWSTVVKLPAALATTGAQAAGGRTSGATAATGEP